MVYHLKEGVSNDDLVVDVKDAADVGSVGCDPIELNLFVDSSTAYRSLRGGLR